MSLPERFMSLLRHRYCQADQSTEDLLEVVHHLVGSVSDEEIHGLVTELVNSLCDTRPSSYEVTFRGFSEDDGNDWRLIWVACWELDSLNDWLAQNQLTDLVTDIRDLKWNDGWTEAHDVLLGLGQPWYQDAAWMDELIERLKDHVTN